MNLTKLAALLALFALSGCAVIDANLAEAQAAMTYDNPLPDTPTIAFYQAWTDNKYHPDRSHCHLKDLMLVLDGRRHDQPTQVRTYPSTPSNPCSGWAVPYGEKLPRVIQFSLLNDDGTRVGGTIDLSSVNPRTYENGGLMYVTIKGSAATVRLERKRICRNVYTGSGQPYWCPKEGDSTSLKDVPLVPVGH